MKKTEDEHRYSQIKKTFPLFFWKICLVCHHWHVREWMWKSESLFHSFLYICRSCAPTRQDAFKIYEERG